MSCHNIGKGMNSVVKVVVELLDDKIIEVEPARRIIAACRKGVNWCDGNEYEAIDCISRVRCGKCMKVIPKGKFLFSVWDVSNKVPDRYKILDNGSIALASDALCESCFDEVINQHCGDETAAEKEREYIMSTQSKEHYLSDGK